MQLDTAGSRIEGIKEVSTHSLIDRSTHCSPAVTLRHDRLREALGDIAAIRFLRHLKDQLIHWSPLTPIFQLNQQRLGFHHHSSSLRLRAS